MASNDLEHRLAELEWTNRRQFNLTVFGFVTCLFTIFLLWFSPSPSDLESARKIEALESRVEALESRVQTLEKAAPQDKSKAPTE